MADKKKTKAAGEIYDEGASDLMRQIDARRSDRAVDAPQRQLDARIRDEKGPGAGRRPTYDGDFRR
ncbi:MAG: hypothetical protein NT024_00560 [Proteobacteria bacterium]|nr:hypothetical protein [Pseudomonadota bacterium]